jgi:hypothetical protein
MGKVSRRKHRRKITVTEGASSSPDSVVEQKRFEKKLRRRSGVPTNPPFFHRLKPIWKFIAGAIAAISTYAGIIGFVMPRLSVEPMSATDASDPYTYVFKIQNQGSLDLVRVSYSCKVKGAWIDGRESPIRIVSDENEWMHMAPVVEGEIYRTLAPAEIDHLACQFFTKPFPFMLEDNRQIALVVDYRPAYFPFRLEKHFSFSLKKSADGTYQWLPIANQRE